MAALPSDRVYQGFWIDYTQGPILGATITTTGDNANLVIAVLSLLLAFSGAHLWDLIAFASYCTGTSKDPRPAFHHQRQFLARNLTSPGSFALEMVKVGWGWRRQKPWSTLAMMTLLSLICSAGFLVAGIFVSLAVSNVGIQVLAESSSCGFSSWQNESTNPNLQFQQLVLNQASIYSEACYNKTGVLPQCNIYAQPNIPIHLVSDAECPFLGLCKTPSAMRLDTGLLESHDIFGINAPLNARVQMQRVVTCAPIDATGFLTTRPMPQDVTRKYDNREPLVRETLYEWSIGPLTANLRPYNSTVWMSSYTSEYSTIYDLTPRAYYAPVASNLSETWHTSTFDPLPIFRKDSADTHILAVQNNGVKFYATSEDPLFAAHREIHLLFDDNSNRTMYKGDSPATFLGCTEQFKFCFPQGPCTDLLGVDQAYHQARQIAPTPIQNITLRYLFLQTPTWYRITTTPMQVTKNSVSFQLGVPPYQWKLEMFAWLNYLLAITQSSITHLAAGPGIVRPDFDALLVAEPLESQDLCHSQQMGAPDGYSNINFLGFILVIAISIVVMVANLTLVPVLKYLHRSNPRYFPRVKLWVEDGMLQVQRKAYEAIGYADWSGTASSVPVMSEKASIPALSDGVAVVDVILQGDKPLAVDLPGA